MQDARVVVFGYGRPALAALSTLDDLGVQPAAVVVPGNRSGSDVEIVSGTAAARGLPLLVQPPRRELAPFLESLARLKPDVLLVWSYSMLLPPAVIALASRGAVNVHGGLLPEYRGGHVMNWAIINGETESAATLHYLDAGIDTGPIVATERFAIASADDAASVQRHLEAAGRSLLRAWWPAVAAGTAPKTPQDESRARYYPMRTAEDGRIDWTQPNMRIHNLARALVAPWPGAFSSLAGRKLVVRRTQPSDSDGTAAPPGTVLRLDGDQVLVACGVGRLRLLAVEVDGRRAGEAELRSAGVRSDARFE